MATPPKVGNTDVEGFQVEQGMIDAAFLAVRTHANKSMYGSYISDEECRAVATEVVTAVEAFRNAKQI